MVCISKVLGWVAITYMLCGGYVCAQGNVESPDTNTIEGKWVVESVQTSLWTFSPSADNKADINFDGAFSRFAFVEEKRATEIRFSLNNWKITKASNTEESLLVLMSCEIITNSKTVPATIDFQVELPQTTKRVGIPKNTKTSLKGIYAFKEDKLIVLVGKDSNRPNEIDDKNFKYRVTCIRSIDEKLPR